MIVIGARNRSRSVQPSYGGMTAEEGVHERVWQAVDRDSRLANGRVRFSRNDDCGKCSRQKTCQRAMVRSIDAEASGELTDSAW